MLILSFPATHILEIIKEQEIFPPSIAIVTDQTGRIIAHTTEHGKFVGKQLPSGFQGGDIANVSDGAPASGYIAATSRSSVAGWNVIVSVPKTAMMAAYRRVWTWLLAMGIGFIVLSILLAAAIARTISAPAQALSEAALALGRGERVTERRTLIREINSVSGALVAASNRIHEGRESEARLATVLRASGEAIYSLSAENIIETWNPAAEKLFGYGTDEIVGQSIDVIVPDEAQKERRQLFSRATPGTVVTFEALRMRKGGECFPAAITVASIPRSANHGSGFVSVARDISDRKAYEERVRFLIAELSHRTKNLLAIVQSVARQTAMNSPNMQAFEQRFGARVQAIAATHDVLVNQNWRGANIKEIVSSQVASLLPDSSHRATVRGEDLLLKTAVAEGLGMALHELAVNAIKYGAFANNSGRVQIAWDVVDGNSPRFTMTWTENGGAPTKPPAKRGFGYAVMTDILERRTDGRVTLEFAAEGLRWRLEAPPEAVLAAPTERLKWA